MQRQHVIVAIEMAANEEKGEIRCYGNLNGLCEAMGWKYNTIVKKGNRFQHNGWIVARVEFQPLKRG